MERSVLIKGMEMPKDGVYWCEIGVAGEIAMITIHGEDRKSFRLVQVQPHSDLIDINALKLAIVNVDYVNKHDYLKGVLNAINNAPIVIPADKDGET